MIGRWIFRKGTAFWFFLLEIWFRTLRVEVNGPSFYDGNRILVFWHSQMFVPVFLNRRNGFTALVSGSEDGNVLSRLLQRLGYSVVEGSSSKGGAPAILRLLRSGHSRIMVTPDGPKGPAQVAKPGVIFLATALKIPVVPVIVDCSRAVKLKTWDRMEIPFPFSRCRVTILEPWIPPKHDRDTQASTLQALLNGLPRSHESDKAG